MSTLLNFWNKNLTEHTSIYHLNKWQEQNQNTKSVLTCTKRWWIWKLKQVKYDIWKLVKLGKLYISKLVNICILLYIPFKLVRRQVFICLDYLLLWKWSKIPLDRSIGEENILLNNFIDDARKILVHGTIIQCNKYK